MGVLIFFAMPNSTKPPLKVPSQVFSSLRLGGTGFAPDVASQGWISAGGNAGYAAAPAAADFPDAPWPGVTLRGAGPLWLGPQRSPAIVAAVKRALDPQNRFPSLNE